MHPSRNTPVHASQSKTPYASCPYASSTTKTQRVSGCAKKALPACGDTLPYPFPPSQLLISLVVSFYFERNRDLENWDVECARKHLDAIKDSVQTLDDLHDSALMEGERAVNVLDLAGMEDAPGLYDDVTQQCRVVFTNEKCLVFTQVKGCAVQ